MSLKIVFLIVGFASIVGAVIGYYLRLIISLGKRGSLELEVKQMILDAKEAAKKITSEAEGKASETMKELRNEMKEKEEKLKLTENRLIKKEDLLDQRQADIDKEVENTVRSAVEIYKKLGVSVVEVSLPHTKYAIDVYYIIQPAEVSSNLNRYDGVRFGNDRDSFADEAKRRIMLGTYVLSAGYYDAFYLKAMKVRTKIIEDFGRVFEKVDAIIAPVSPTPPFRLGEKSSNPLEMYLADTLTAPANIAGIPGISVPGGFSKNGLPIGFQLLGPRWGEDKLFSLGELFQNETDYHFKMPLIK